jgi:DNA helicase-2/ATP-dependent DNA helicase PcrA
MTSGGLFPAACVDYRQTFADALALSQYETASGGLLELSRRRTATHRPPPAKAVSTIHKAKGLSSEAVVLLPCDDKTFPNTAAARRKLYVALTRAVSSLTIVLPRTKVSPLFKV